MYARTWDFLIHHYRPLFNPHLGHPVELSRGSKSGSYSWGNPAWSFMKVYIVRAQAEVNATRPSICDLLVYIMCLCNDAVDAY